MLLSMEHLDGYALRARDGAIGKVVGFLFDDRQWLVRYLLAKAPRWGGREVLLSPAVVGRPTWPAEELRVDLTVSQIEDSPPVDADRPVSRQEELRLARHYGWPIYWTPMGAAVPPPEALPPEEEPADVSGDPHLRSSKEVIGYHILASDGKIGHVEDLVFDTGDWTVRYLVIDTRDWLPGRKVLVDPQWAETIDWMQRTVRVELTTEQIEASPRFDPGQPVNREYEQRLFDFYGRPAYWEQA